MRELARPLALQLELGLVLALGGAPPRFLGGVELALACLLGVRDRRAIFLDPDLGLDALPIGALCLGVALGGTACLRQPLDLAQLVLVRAPPIFRALLLGLRCFDGALLALGLDALALDLGKPRALLLLCLPAFALLEQLRLRRLE